MNLWANILNTIFPDTCISCNKRGSRICQKCLNLVNKSKEHDYKKIYSVYDYRNPFIKKILLENKYKNKQHAIEPLIPIVVDELIEIISEKFGLLSTEKIYITEIPMSKKRLHYRTINHGKNLAVNISKEFKKRGFNIIQESLLKKIFETIPQAKIKNKKERLENIKGSFELCKIKNKETPSMIIVIDDISTTGATLIEAEKTLHKHGFKKVLLFSIAH